MNNQSLAEDRAYWRTKCARLEQDNQRLEAERDSYKAALKHIEDPLGYIIEYAKANGAEISHLAFQLADSGNYLKQLARDALQDAARKAGEEQG